MRAVSGGGGACGCAAATGTADLGSYVAVDALIPLLRRRRRGHARCSQRCQHTRLRRGGWWRCVAGGLLCLCPRGRALHDRERLGSACVRPHGIRWRPRRWRRLTCRRRWRRRPCRHRRAGISWVNLDRVERRQRLIDAGDVRWALQQPIVRLAGRVSAKLQRVRLRAIEAKEELDIDAVLKRRRPPGLDRRAVERRIFGAKPNHARALPWGWRLSDVTRPGPASRRAARTPLVYAIEHTPAKRSHLRLEDRNLPPKGACDCRRR